jgi:anaerobic ribonucleoside-triphosphate reductase activating protein
MGYMIVGGMMFQSFIEHQGKILAGVFFAGCNFRCPWCQNKGLIDGKGKVMDPIDVYNELTLNNFLIDGILISGGEPTIQHDLEDLIDIIRERNPDFFIAINTNGSRPDVLKKIINKVNFVSLDVKGGYDAYDKITPKENARLFLSDSLALLRPQDEIRITILESDSQAQRNLTMMGNIFRSTNIKAPIVLQAYRPPPGEEGNYMKSPGTEELESIANFFYLNFGLKCTVRR